MIQEVDAVLPYPLFLGMSYMEVADFFYNKFGYE